MAGGGPPGDVLGAALSLAVGPGGYRSRCNEVTGADTRMVGSGNPPHRSGRLRHHRPGAQHGYYLAIDPTESSVGAWTDTNGQLRAAFGERIRRCAGTARVRPPVDYPSGGRNGGRPSGFDPGVYAQRNTVERCINRSTWFSTQRGRGRSMGPVTGQQLDRVPAAARQPVSGRPSRELAGPTAVTVVHSMARPHRLRPVTAPWPVQASWGRSPRGTCRPGH